MNLYRKPSRRKYFTVGRIFPYKLITTVKTWMIATSSWVPSRGERRLAAVDFSPIRCKGDDELSGSEECFYYDKLESDLSTGQADACTV